MAKATGDGVQDLGEGDIQGCERRGLGPRPVIKPEWRTPAVLALAEAAYAEPRRVKCGRCGGGGVLSEQGQDYGPGPERPCHACSGAGTITDGLLDNDNLARLSDALEEAGCPQDGPCPECGGNNHWGGLVETEMGPVYKSGVCHACHKGRVPNALLLHLRDPGPHAKGCHVVDLLLGKE